MLVEAFIAKFCLDMSNIDYEACSKTLEAMSIKTEVTKNAKLLEDKTSEMVYKTAEKYTSKEIAGATGAIIKTVKDKSVTYPILRRSQGKIPTITPTLGIEGGRINLDWKF